MENKIVIFHCADYFELMLFPIGRDEDNFGTMALIGLTADSDMVIVYLLIETKSSVFTSGSTWRQSYGER